MPSVRIRGTGVVSTFGMGTAALVAGLRAGHAHASSFDDTTVPSLRGVQVNRLPDGLFPDGERGTIDIALAAIDEALRHARVQAPLGDCALLVGGTNHFSIAEHDYLQSQRESPGPPRHHVRDPGFVATRLAQALGVRGPVLTFSTACSSSANALLVARDMLVRKQIARALVVGVDSLSRIALSGFQSLMLLDAQGCRPFDADRDGLQLGEGAAALLLEATGAGPTLLGGANLCDTHHVTSATPDGSGMARCMRAALSDAGEHTVVAIKAHGTGSPENDTAEAAAMHTVFGSSLPPFTALKRYLGHTLGTCGAIETVALLATLEAGFIPATAGFSQVDSALQATPMIEARPALAGPYLLNFFGFGGNYASLVIGHE